MAKYKTGDLVMIPAEIIAAREENGKIAYETRANTYDVPEGVIRVDDTATAQMAFDRAMSEIARPDFYGW